MKNGLAYIKYHYVVTKVKFRVREGEWVGARGGKERQGVLRWGGMRERADRSSQFKKIKCGMKFKKARDMKFEKKRDVNLKKSLI